MELEAVDGQMKGYAKPILDNVVIFDLQKDLDDGVFSAAWQAVVGALGRVFRNQPKDRIASQIEISGSLDQKYQCLANLYFYFAQCVCRSLRSTFWT